MLFEPTKNSQGSSSRTITALGSRFSASTWYVCPPASSFEALLTLWEIYGGTNWGNLGQPGAYTSYDYGSAIREDRMLDREKFSELKLQAHFITSSPAYLVAVPGNETNTSYVSTGEITTTPLVAESSSFYVTRHSDWRTFQSTQYSITLPTSAGNFTIPQLGGSLTLDGRDSKIHVTDYDVSGLNLLYSSADVFTHSKNDNKRTLLLYGGAGETHELAFASQLGKPSVEGDGVKVEHRESTVVVQWKVTTERKVLHYKDLDVYLLWRNEAYNYWLLELEAPTPIGNYSSVGKESIIIKAGYLMRSVSRVADSLHFVGDFNGTTEVEVISGHNSGRCSIYLNGHEMHVASAHGRLLGTVDFEAPEISLPNMSSLEWKYIDSLPEVEDTYDDSMWTQADLPLTNRRNYDENGTVFVQQTPTSLISGDYGYSTGSLIYRGHFTATGSERTLNLTTQGGRGHGHSVWLGNTFLGSYTGAQLQGTTIDPFDSGGTNIHTSIYNITMSLTEGEEYVLTILIDYMGTETNWTPGLDLLKTPRGIMDYSLNTHEQEDITWRLTGNLGGEQYRDQARGPLNEGAFFAERQGYHYPSPPSSDWESRSPLQGIPAPGIGFYTADFELDMPVAHDIPLSFVFNNSVVDFSSQVSDPADMSGNADEYRVQLFVNGWQFGVYINRLGPQTRFPVPEGILNYWGTNTVAMTLWAQLSGGAKLAGFELKADGVVQSGMMRPRLVESPVWEERAGAY